MREEEEKKLIFFYELVANIFRMYECISFLF